MLDLNDLVDPAAGWELTYAADINDTGQIVGTGRIGGVQHGFLLSPVPEPSSAVLLVLGALGLLTLARARRWLL